MKPDPNGTVPCCGELIEFSKGVVHAIVEDINPISIPSNASTYTNTSYRKGERAGHIVAAVAGLVETIGGVGGDAIAAAGTYVSGGTALAATAPLAIVSTEAIVHGLGTFGKATYNLNSEGGKNGGTFGAGKDTHGNGSSNASLRNAKEQNGIPRSQQPDKTIKPNTPAGDKARLDSRNVRQYEYTNSKGEKKSIREDKPAKYNEGGTGDQGKHHNAGNSGGKLNQHHYD